MMLPPSSPPIGYGLPGQGPGCFPVLHRPPALPALRRVALPSWYGLSPSVAPPVSVPHCGSPLSSLLSPVRCWPSLCFSDFISFFCLSQLWWSFSLACPLYLFVFGFLGLLRVARFCSLASCVGCLPCHSLPFSFFRLFFGGLCDRPASCPALGRLPAPLGLPFAPRVPRPRPSRRFVQALAFSPPAALPLVALFGCSFSPSFSLSLGPFVFLGAAGSGSWL